MDTHKVRFEIESIPGVPLKMDRFHGLPDPKTPDGYLKQAEEKCYRDSNGDLAIPAEAVKACMRLASSELGKKMDGKKNRQSISAGVMFIEPFLSMGRKDHDGIVGNPVTRGKGDKVTRVITYRPHVTQWKVAGTISLLDISVDFAMRCLVLGGTRYGLLSHRPEFGRFVVNKFEVVK